MTVLDDELVPEVKELIESVGVQATYYATPLNVYDPTKGRAIVGDGTKSVITSTPPLGFSKWIAEDSTHKDMMKVFILPTITPEVGAQIDINGISYTIETVFPLFTGVQIAAYKLELKK